MKINKAISTVMKEKGCSLRQMAVYIGKDRPNDVSARLASKNMTFDKAIEMLSALGYEVIVQPVTAGQRKDGSIVITKEEEE